mmetsp:Transcript_31294/g.96685  ORF Transcript_31294/g.96685 Transcript_31294/m.96685 type:complete len:210 (+) Transcript_31294:264-893(+)
MRPEFQTTETRAVAERTVTMLGSSFTTFCSSDCHSARIAAAFSVVSLVGGGTSRGGSSNLYKVRYSSVERLPQIAAPSSALSRHVWRSTPSRPSSDSGGGPGSVGSASSAAFSISSRSCAVGLSCTMSSSTWSRLRIALAVVAAFRSCSACTRASRCSASAASAISVRWLFWFASSAACTAAAMAPPMTSVRKRSSTRNPGWKTETNSG